MATTIISVFFVTFMLFLGLCVWFFEWYNKENEEEGFVPIDHEKIERQKAAENAHQEELQLDREIRIAQKRMMLKKINMPFQEGDE